MRPYFERDGIVIYHGDCREVLPTLETGLCDLLLTDPPFLHLDGGLNSNLPGVSQRYRPSITVGDPWKASLDWVADAWRVTRLGAMIFCAYRSVCDTRLALADADVVGLMTWYTRNASLPIHNVPHYDSEFIWLFRKAPGLRWRHLDSTVIDIPKLSTGCFASPERFVDRTGRAIHPTQKPLRLMHRLLRVGGQTILDPFVGTGTTLVAAFQLGRRAVGIELDERYAEIAANRLRQAILPLAADPLPTQLGLEVS